MTLVAFAMENFTQDNRIAERFQIVPKWPLLVLKSPFLQPWEAVVNCLLILLHSLDQQRWMVATIHLLAHAGLACALSWSKARVVGDCIGQLPRVLVKGAR